LSKKRLATLNLSDQGIMQFSDELRYFEWNAYPLKALPQHFCADYLVEIHLPHSKVEYLWEGMQVRECIFYFATLPHHTLCTLRKV
jgi:hypothetical protein